MPAKDKIAVEGFEGLFGSDLIQETFLFQSLNFTEAMEMARLCHKELRKSGDVIIEENSLGQALYIVEEGRVKVVKGEGRMRKELALLGRGELFGEMSLIEDSLTSASVIADTDVELISIVRGEFEKMLAANESLALKIYKSFCRVLSERLRRTSEQILYDKPQTAASAEKTKKETGPAAGKAKGRTKSSRKGGRG